MGVAKRKLALACLTVVASAAALLSLHGLLALEPPAAAAAAKIQPAERDLNEIVERGVLKIEVCPDDLAYRVEEGEPSGLAYDIGLRVARRLGMRVETVVARNATAGLLDVLRGEADILALIDSGPKADGVPAAWTGSFETTPPVLYGRGAAAIRSFGDLRGKTVAVVKGSVLEDLAFRWQKRLGGDLTIRQLPMSTSVRELASLAGRGAVPLAVMDQDRARLEIATADEMQMSAPLDAPQPVRWALRPNSPQLLKTTAKVLDEMRTLGLIADLQRQYIETPDSWRAPDGQGLSPFDGIFRAAGKQHGLDWRLLAALSLTESGHNAQIQGPAGATGLMQLLPETARAFGVANPRDPAQNVNGGARILRWLHDVLPGATEEDRIAFTLAAYNMGLGHFDDARRLAAARGLDADRWEGGVAEVLPIMDRPEVAATLTHGQTHGVLTRGYVAQVLRIFRSYSGGRTGAIKAAMLAR